MAGIQCLYWIIIFNKLTFHCDTKKQTREPVTIVVSIKNERENLPELLTFLRTQQHPQYEIIIVDDFSDDDSYEFLSKQDDIILLQPACDKPGKKEALETGIGKARYNYILVTDADCRGKSEDWISSMISAKGNKQIVLGYAPLTYKNLLSYFASFEAWIIAIQYLSYAKWGIPYMGVGRNLLFEKSIFIENKGYDKHKDLASGDDDLLIREIARADNTTISLTPSSYMYSAAPDSPGILKRQKKRHYSTAPRYKTIHKLLLMSWSGSLMAFYLFLFVYIGYTENWKTGITIWAVRIFIQWVVAILIAIRMREIRFIVLFPFLDVLLAVFYWLTSPLLIIKTRIDWS